MSGALVGFSLWFLSDLEEQNKLLFGQSQGRVQTFALFRRMHSSAHPGLRSNHTNIYVKRKAHQTKPNQTKPNQTKPNINSTISSSARLMLEE
jgi:hypothetical protein